MNRPQIKPAHNPVWTKDGKIQIGSMQFGVGSEIATNDNSAVWRLFELMDGSRSPEQIVADFGESRPDIELADARSLLEALIDGGFVQDAGADLPSVLTERDLERHERGAQYYSWADTSPRSSPWEIQARLKNASVTVVGLGGAGSAATTALVASGIGAVHCVDHDVVELSNLNRQFLYTENDIGRGKVECALARLASLNSDVELSGEDLEVRGQRDVERLMRACDLLMLCADRPEPFQILNWTNDAALRLEKPWILSFYAGPMIVVGLQDPPRTPCYRCLRHIAEENGRVQEGDDVRFLIPDSIINAVIAPSACLAGSTAALEAIYFLGDLEPSTAGRIFHMSLTDFEFQYSIEGERWADCPSCARSTSRPTGALTSSQTPG